MRRKIAIISAVLFTALPTLGFLPQFAADAAQPRLFGDPLPKLSPQQAADFLAGQEEFSQTHTVADGLGPVFNGRACSGCHRAPAVGGASNRLLTRFGTTTGGQFDPLSALGGSLIQDRAIGPADGSDYQFTPESVPAAATITALRRTQPLFGLGLVDAVPDESFIDLAARELKKNPATAGRVNMVTDPVTGDVVVGKFGWKAQVPSLFVFAGDAYNNEMGITNPIFPNEQCPQGDCSELLYNPAPWLNDTGSGLRSLTDYMSLLGDPPRGQISGAVLAGEQVFEGIGCGDCHVSRLVTGDNPVGALNHKTFRPYSDFLLHDIGTGDGIAQGDALGNEMRTAPLWGLRTITLFLHNGSATTVEAAILAHGGQATASHDAYVNLSAGDSANLEAFLGSL